MFTQQHFEHTAGVLRSFRPPPDTDQFAPWRAMVVSFAQDYEARNPRFDRDKFFRACGLVVLSR